MINIIINCTPNYKKHDIINTVRKEIDIVSQFIVLYHSIRENWNLKHRISLFHNKSFPFSEHDLKRLLKLDIDIYAIEPDYEKTPYMLRCNALTHKIKKPGSHRLLLDCDMVALEEPNFDLSCDWQAMYANSMLSKDYCDYINLKYGYDLNLENKVCGPLFRMYIEGDGKSENFFPHFNGGAFLIREELCESFSQHTIPSYQIAHDSSVPHHVRHIGVQYGASFALAKMSDNWKPFDAGFNYLAKEYDIDTFGKQNIQLLHYCGINAYAVARKHFGEKIDDYLR